MLSVNRIISSLLSLALAISLCAAPRQAAAHCDTLDGPVVQAARIALERGDVTPVLKWVKEQHEEEIKELFQITLEVRAMGEEVRTLADTHFFESLVRIHRAGEGAPYTGLKPGDSVEPAVAAADDALETGSADALVEKITQAIEKSIRERFTSALEKKRHAEHNVDAGREFVEAYVEYVHFVEGIHEIVSRGSGHHQTEGSKVKSHNH